MARKPRAEFEITAQDRSAAQLRQAERRLQQVSGSVRTFALAATGAFIGLGAALLSTTKRLDGVAKAAKSAGIGGEVFQAWEFAASQAGVSTEQFRAGLDRANKTVGDAANGLGTGAKLFDRLGVAIRDVEGNVRPTEDVIRDTADAIQGLKSPAEQAAAASELLGRTAGPKMVGLLNQGSEGLKAYEDRARELGIVIRDETLQSAEALTDKMDELSRVINAQTAEAILGNAEAIEALGNAFGLVVNKTIGAVSGATNVIQFLAEEVAARVGGIAANDLPRLIGAVQTAESRLESLREMQSKSIVPQKFDSEIAQQQELIEKARERVQLAIRLNSIEAEARASVPAAAEDVAEPTPGLTEAEKKALVEREEQRLKLRREFALQFQAEVEKEAQALAEAEERRFQESLARAAGFADLAAQEAFARDEQLFLAQMEARARRFEEEIALELGFKDARDRTIEEAEQAHQDRLLEIRTREFGQFQSLAIELAKFETKTAREKTQFVLQQAQQLTAGLAANSKAAFNLNKAVSIAEAIVNTATGVTAALRLGPKGIPLAALIAAQGAAQVATIQSTQFGGGASGLTSRGPGTGIPSLANDISPPPTVSAEDRNNSTITLRIDAGDSEIARTIFRNARQVADDEDDILFSSRSRQAIEVT